VERTRGKVSDKQQQCGERGQTEFIEEVRVGNDQFDVRRDEVV